MYVCVYIYIYIVMGWRSAESHSPGTQQGLNAALIITALVLVGVGEGLGLGNQIAISTRGVI